MAAATIVRVWPVGPRDDPVDYGRGAFFKVHPDGDLTIERRGEMFATWARGEWSRVEVVPKPTKETAP